MNPDMMPPPSPTFPLCVSPLSETAAYDRFLHILIQRHSQRAIDLIQKALPDLCTIMTLDAKLQQIAEMLNFLAKGRSISASNATIALSHNRQCQL
jgi:hypothetical protein